MPDDVNDELVAEEVKSSKLPMILGVLATFIVGGAVGFGGSSFMGGGDESAESGEKEGEKGEEGPATGLFNLGLFTVNLRGTGGGRVVRMEIQVQTEADSRSASPSSATPSSPWCPTIPTMISKAWTARPAWPMNSCPA